MPTRTAILLAIACFGGGVLLGVVVRPRGSPPTLPEPPPEEAAATTPAETEAEAPPAADPNAELTLLRQAVKMAESECSSRFVAAGCIEHIAWPAGSDAAAAARRIEQALRSCSGVVDPESIVVDCDEYPCGLAYRSTTPNPPDVAEMARPCPKLEEVTKDLSPRGYTGGMSTDRTGITHTMLLLPSFDASPEVVAAAELRATPRLRELTEMVTPIEAAP